MNVLTSFAQVFSENSPTEVRRDESVDIRSSVSPESLKTLVDYARSRQASEQRWSAMFEQTLDSREYQQYIDHAVELAFQVGYLRSRLDFEQDRSRLRYTGNLTQAEEEALKDRLVALEDDLSILKEYLPESHDGDLSDRVYEAERVGWAQYRLNLEVVAKSQGREGYLTLSQEFDLSMRIRNALEQAVYNVLVNNPYLQG